MKRLLQLQLSVCVAAAACPPLAPEPALANGRSGKSTYIEVAGSDLQITNIKKYASLHGWAIDCEKRVGNQMTLRLRFPPDVTQSQIEAYFSPPDIWRSPDHKSNMIYPSMPRTKGAGCILLP